MVTRILVLLVLPFLPASAAPAEKFQLGKLHDAVQDATGRVWMRDADAKSLCATDGEKWERVPHPDAGRIFSHWALARAHDGAVYCFWTDGDHSRHFVTRHVGEEWQALCEFEAAGLSRTAAASMSHETVYIARNGDIWITPDAPHVYHVTPGGDAKKIDLPEDWYAAAQSALHTNLRPVVVVEDDIGRIWFFASSGTGRTLTGLASFTDGKLQHHARIEGLPDQASVSLLESRPNSRGWLVSDRLYEVDFNTLKATPVDVPQASGRMSAPRRIFSVHNDWYFGGNVELWRLRSGQWQRLYPEGNGKGAFPLFGSNDRGSRFGLLGLEQGVLISGITRSMYAPFDESEARILPLNPPGFGKYERLFRLNDGRVMIFNASTCWIDAIDLPGVRYAKRLRHQLLPTLNPVHDQTGSVWTLRHWSSEDEPRILERRDARAWTAFTVPEEVEKLFAGVKLDLQNRLWLIPRLANRPTAIFDVATTGWKTHPTLMQALEEECARAPGLSWKNHAATPIVTSSDGRIAFARDEIVACFENGGWQSWAMREIAGRSSARPESVFFNEHGNVTVVSGAVAWEWAGQRWVMCKPASTASPTAERLEISPRPDSMCRDNHGTIWLTRANRLYRVAPDGSELPVFGPEEIDPFADGSNLVASTWENLPGAYVDPHGTAFLHIGAGLSRRSIWVAISPVLAAPETTAELVSLTQDKAVVRWQSDSGDWVRWRINGGSWSPGTAEREVVFEMMPNGRHVVELSAINAEMRADATPERIEFEIKVDIDAAIKQLLAGSASTREKAIRQLARDPRRALPALEAARTGATDDRRWWLDAALQEIQRLATKEDDIQKRP